MPDPFDQIGADASGNQGPSNNPDFWRNLQNFGFAAMAAGGHPGATTLGALGEAGLSASENARTNALARAQYQNLGAETQGKQISNATSLYPLMMRNYAMQQAGMPTLPMPNVPGMYQPQQPPAQQAQNTPPSTGLGYPIMATAGMSRPDSGGGKTQNIGQGANQPASGASDQQRIALIGIGKIRPQNADEAYQGALYAQYTGNTDLAKQLVEYSLSGQKAGAEAKAKAPYSPYSAKEGEITFVPGMDMTVYGAQPQVDANGATVRTPAHVGYGGAPGVESTQGSSRPPVPAPPTPDGIPINGNAMSVDQVAGAMPNIAPQGSGASNTIPGTIQTALAPGTKKIIEDLASQYVEKETPAYQSALMTKGNVQQMKEDLRNVNESSFLTPGSNAQGRLAWAKSINTYAQAMGAKLPIDPMAVGSAEQANKLTRFMGMQSVNQYFGAAREAASTIMSTVSAQPGIDNTMQGNKMILNAIDEGANYQKDLYDFKTNWMKEHNGNLIGSDLAFNKMNPPEKYSQRAISQVHPINVNKPAAIKSLLPGTYIKFGSHQPKMIPYPSDQGGP